MSVSYLGERLCWLCQLESQVIEGGIKLGMYARGAWETCRLLRRASVEVDGETYSATDLGDADWVKGCTLMVVEGR